MVKYNMRFVRSMRHFFPWSKKGVNDCRIYNRINHCIPNATWFLKYESVVVQYLNRGISDHSPQMLEVGLHNDRGGRPFKVFNHLIKHPQFEKIVKEEGWFGHPKRDFISIRHTLEKIKG